MQSPTERRTATETHNMVADVVTKQKTAAASTVTSCQKWRPPLMLHELSGAPGHRCHLPGLCLTSTTEAASRDALPGGQAGERVAAKLRRDLQT